MRAPRARLEEAIIATTMELMDYGGTTPRQTFEVMLENFPDLCRGCEVRDVIALCARIQQAALPGESERFQELFRRFNVRYFEGRLPTYGIHVVYDVNFWANEYFFNGRGLEEFSLGYIDRENKRIFVRQSESSMEGALFHEMGHAATTDEHDDEWLAEMRRLQALGAPVLFGDVEPSYPGPQLELSLTIVFAPQRIFGADLLTSAAPRGPGGHGSRYKAAKSDPWKQDTKSGSVRSRPSTRSISDVQF